MPSSKSAASEPSGSSISARCASRSRRSSSRRCASTMPIGSARPACGGGDELQVELGEVGLRPADLGEPLADALLAEGGEHVDLALAIPRRGVPVEADQAGLLQPTEDDVDLAGVQRLAEGAERVVEPGAQLVALGGLLRQHRQHDFLLHLASDITVMNRVTVISDPVNGSLAWMSGRGVLDVWAPNPST